MGRLDHGRRLARQLPRRQGQARRGLATATRTPRTLALSYFALGDGAKDAAQAYLGDYYAFAGDYAQMVVDSAATDADTVRAYVQGFTDAGCDELIFFPSSPDPDQVDLLADAVL